jgi:hypothetical protein
VPPAQPGSDAQISLALNAPQTPGTYFGDWRMYDAQGNPFGATLWLRIVVPGQPAAISTPGVSPGAAAGVPAVPGLWYSRRVRRGCLKQGEGVETACQQD